MYGFWGSNQAIQAIHLSYLVSSVEKACNDELQFQDFCLDVLPLCLFTACIFTAQLKPLARKEFLFKIKKEKKIEDFISMGIICKDIYDTVLRMGPLK